VELGLGGVSFRKGEVRKCGGVWQTGRQAGLGRFTKGKLFLLLCGWSSRPAGTEKEEGRPWPAGLGEEGGWTCMEDARQLHHRIASPTHCQDCQDCQDCEHQHHGQGRQTHSLFLVQSKRLEGLDLCIGLGRPLESTPYPNPAVGSSPPSFSFD
jgi:hypothetical protein